MRLSQFAPVAVAFVAAALLPTLAGCPQNSGDPSTIKIVSSLPRTGSARVQTDTIVNGIRMALEEVESQVGPFHITYTDMDDATAAAGQWDAVQEQSNAERAVRDPDVMVYIGTYNSGAAKISMPILNQADLLMISPANTAVELTKPGFSESGEPEVYRPTGRLNYVRVVPADDLQGSLAAEWAHEMDLKRVYILDDKEVYGRGVAMIFEQRALELGMEVLGHDSIDVKAQEFKSLFTRIKGTNPDLVYFGGTTQSKGGQLAKDLVAAGLDARLMVPDGCMEQAFIDSAGAGNLNDRCYVTFGGLPPRELTGRGKEFVDKYVAKHGKEPEAYAVYGYEAAKVALEAIRRAGQKDRRAIADACLAIRDFEGALGAWSFDENGDTTLRVLSGNVVRDGRFEFVKRLGEAEGDGQ